VIPPSEGRTSRGSTIPAPVRGAALMLFACLCFAGMTGLVRLGTGELHPFQVAFLRIFFGLVCMLPWIVRAGRDGLRTTRLGLYGLRGLTGLIAMLMWFTAIATLPLGEATALSFTAPLFATVLAAVVLHEVVRARRWTATIVGFAGAMIILRPGAEAIAPAALLALGSAVFMAASVTVIKALSRTEPTHLIVAYMAIMLTPLALVPALFVWQWPTLAGWLIGAGMGVLGTMAHLAFTAALKQGDASAVLPFDFARLPFVAAIGYFAFGEVLDGWTLVGAGVIGAAAVYITQRETRVARAQGAETVAAPTAAHTIAVHPAPTRQAER